MAAPAFIARTVTYAGMVTVEFHTYTESYVPFHGAWQFNTNSYIPMEFYGFSLGGEAGDYPVGLFARTMDVASGYTTLSVGNNAIANINPDFTEGCWQNNRLRAYAFNGSKKRFYCYDYPLKPGVSSTVPTLALHSSIILPDTPPNTFAPQSGIQCNMPMANGYVAGSYVTALDPTYCLTNGSGIVPGTGLLQLGISNQFFALNGIAYKGQSWVQCGNPSSLADRGQLMATNWINDVVRYSITFANPPGGGTDIDALMTQNGIHGQTTMSGFLHIEKSVGVVEGQTLQGYGVLVSPDYTQYQIIKFIPRDATAANWMSFPGDYQAKLDASGALWMKNVNFHDTLFVSSGNIVRSLPIYPPFPMPPLNDADGVVRQIRGL